LCSLKKQIDITATKTSELPPQLSKTQESQLIKFIDYSRFDFRKYDLFISPDSGSWQQIVDSEDVKIPDIPIIVIDHHESNEKFGRLNLVDPSAASCAQIIYYLFKDWEYFIDTNTANLLMTGIVGDSGGFAFGNDPKSMFAAGELIELGANKEKIIKDLFRTNSFAQIKAYGQYLTRFQIDYEHKFVWTALSNKEYLKFKIPPKASSMVSTQFSSTVEGTNFGIVMTETEKNVLHIGFRSRSDIDVSKLAEKLNGGGHKKASGGMITGMPFKKAVEKVLETARKYAKENS
jgi:phosphoesterase RecJ-like protein